MGGRVPVGRRLDRRARAQDRRRGNGTAPACPVELEYPTCVGEPRLALPEARDPGWRVLALDEFQQRGGRRPDPGRPGEAPRHELPVQSRRTRGPRSGRTPPAPDSEWIL